MAKPIKFNLILDGNQVRSIEQLRDNFVIEDLLGYYREGLLERWLQVRGYESERVDVSGISKDLDDRQVVEKLIDIFQIETDSNVVDNSLYSIEYKRNMKALNELSFDSKENLLDNIDLYKSGYVVLIKEIFENPNDLPRIKAIIKSIGEYYSWIFSLTYRSFVNFLIDRSPCAMFCLMMNPFTKAIITGESNVCFPGNQFRTNIRDRLSNFRLGEFFRMICEPLSFNSSFESFLTKSYNDWEKEDHASVLVKIRNKASDDNVLDSLGDNVKKIADNTEGYFRDFVEKGKKCMVLKMYNYSGGPKVSSWRETDSSKIYGTSDVNGKFLILDGISYNGYSSSSKYLNYLYYMEV